MPIVDPHGRLFGRLNLLDAALGVMLLALVPLAYGAYVLFRTPPPRLLAVEPTEMVSAADLRVLVKGENLRPYMRVSFDAYQGQSFIFRNTTEAHVDLVQMPPGVYDVVLYDNAQERARLPQAFTLLPPPLPASQVIVVGAVGNLDAERAAQLKPGVHLQGVGEIIAAAAPESQATRVMAGGIPVEIPVERMVRLPVTVRAHCTVRAPEGVPQCVVGATPLQPTSIVPVQTPVGPFPFQIDQLRGTQPLEDVQVVVQFVNRRELLSQLRAGDVDRGAYHNPLAAGATVLALSPPLTVGADTIRLDATLKLDAQRGASSWIYASAPLRSGSPFTLRTSQYTVDGVVLRVEPEWTANGVSQ